jgi:hypothetical protein
MRRREFIAGLNGAVLLIAAWYLLKETHAQQSEPGRAEPPATLCSDG